MTVLRTLLREGLGLFVDDGRFALAILVWLAVVALLLPRLAIPPVWSGLILFAGLALILLESTLRRARR